MNRAASVAHGATQLRVYETPTIQLSIRQLDTVVDEAIDALARANDPPTLFMRTGSIVAIRHDEAGRAFVADASEMTILDHLAGAARWLRFNRDGAAIEAGPSRPLAGVVLARLQRAEGALPALRGIVESPLLRPDGTLLDRPGYDPDTRLFYAPPADFVLPPVPDQPNAEEAGAAIRFLDEMLGDFPMVSDADRATALAALLSIPLREIVSGCVPAFLFDAPAPGTGKGLLADCITMAATGSLGAKSTEPDGRSDDEWRKRITALLAGGRAVCLLDNVERPLGSPSLAALLTTESWSDRLLGKSRMLTLPHRAAWLITGNNIRLRGDLPRRCVWCRLDAKVARPWTRTGFQHPNLLEWVGERRGEILAAVFTLARAWIAAGRPGPKDSTPRLGSFDGWRDVIGGVLEVAGIPGFLGNLNQLYESADDDSPAWSGFLVAWCAHYGETPVSVSQLLEQLQSGGELSETVPPEIAEALDATACSKRVGHVLKRKAETRYVASGDGCTVRLVRVYDAHAKAARWSVVRQSGCGV